jgi:DNA-directed RNA polymerase subunit RPC12/RpoP
MIATAFTCRICHRTNGKLYGHNSAGTRRYHCEDCGTTRIVQPKKALSAETEQAMERLNDSIPRCNSVSAVWCEKHFHFQRKRFSKKEYMLNLHFKLFAFFYNQEIATSF